MSYPDFQKINTVILGISVDSVFTHKVWNESELSKMVDGGLPYPLLADQNGQVGRLYGVYDEMNGVHLRGTFILDPDDKVQSSEILGTAVGRNSDELLRKVKAFQHHASTGELIPADWEEGGKTLKGDPEKAGKVWEEWVPERERELLQV